MAEKRKAPLHERDKDAWKKLKLDYVDTVLVVVGEAKQHFVAYKEVITRRSPFFAAACAEKWNRNEPVNLGAHEPRVFSIYLQCLYQDTIVGVGRDSLTFADLIDLYILADEIGDLWTANNAIDAVMEHRKRLNRLPPANLMGCIFKSTPDSSPLRRLMVDYWIFDADPDVDAVSTKAADMPHAFLSALFTRYANQKSENCYPYVSICEAFQAWGAPGNQVEGHYHQHDLSRHTYCCLHIEEPTDSNESE